MGNRDILGNTVPHTKNKKRAWDRMKYRIAVDTGGTFTDVVVASEDGALTLGKSPSTAERSSGGVIEGMRDAARNLSIELSQLIADTNVLIYGTTWATNAIITGTTAKTAILLTAGFPDILVYRQGGKLHPFELQIDPLKPYVPRHLTVEVPERINAEGGIEQALNEEAVSDELRRLAGQQVEAVAVCLLWSIKNPIHEALIGELIEEVMPGVPYTLSHQLNPILREYPRASSTAIDASLKPRMQRHLGELQADLADIGFAGELLVSTVSGGVMHVEDVAGRPIYMVKSGPAMAPRAGLAYAEAESLSKDVLVVDTGGTTFDVSLVRDGEVKFTRETWLGPLFYGHNLGLSSVDVRSVGAGGGSIAWIDTGGLLRVGPGSAGAVPGPACYGRGGDEPTVTDAAVVLGYIDPAHFLGGRMPLNVAAARGVVGKIANALGLELEEAAFSIIRIASESMIKAIEEITVNEGVNPRESILVAGGGAAGLNILPIADALGCRQVLLPKTAGALSACGAQYSDVVAEFSASQYVRTDHWDAALVSETIIDIERQMDEFVAGLRKRGIEQFEKQFFVDARYLNQQWETEIQLASTDFGVDGAVAALIESFHQVHERLYGVKEENGMLECLHWKGRLIARLDRPTPQLSTSIGGSGAESTRNVEAYFGEHGRMSTPVYLGAQLAPGAKFTGPAIIEEPTTTVVVYPGMTAEVSAGGNYLLDTAPDMKSLPVADDAPIDSIDLAIMANRVDAILREMQGVVMRTARSAVIGQSRDFSCSIVTAENELLATAEGIPAHIFGSHLQTASIAREHPDYREGDAYLHNDPYDGNSHAADWSIMVPVFCEGDHLFTVTVKGHQADCGDSIPTTYTPRARDVYEEGALIFPCVQIQRDGQDNEDIIRMCRRRIRVPDQWYGDYLSQLGAARIGERRLKEFVDKYGMARVRQFITDWFDYAERRARHAIAKLPKGTLINKGTHDPVEPFLPEGVEITVKVDIDPEAEMVTVDLRDNPDCIDAGLNLTEACASANAIQGVFENLEPDLPANAGSFRRVNILLRENCVVGIPRFPHCCSLATTSIADVVVNLTQSAFTQLGDGYGMSQGNLCFAAGMGVISGTDWRRGGEEYINQVYVMGGGGPAQPANDGMIYLLTPGGAGLLHRDSVEFDEQRFPVMVRSQKLLANSGGAGRQRGGPATEVVFGPRHDPMTISIMGGGAIHPPRGVLGGRDANNSYHGHIKNDGSEESQPNGVMLTLDAGEFVRSIDNGGSGYGDPVRRKPEAVLEDVVEKFVTRDVAEEIYGVVLSGSAADGSLAVDAQASTARRDSMAKVAP